MTHCPMFKKILLFLVTITAAFCCLAAPAPSEGTDYTFSSPVQAVPSYMAQISYDKLSDAAALEKHFLSTADVIDMPAGTQAKLLEAHLGQSGMMRPWVKAAFGDGTIGYVPTILLAREVYYYVNEGKTVMSDKGKLPAGQYTVSGCGPLVYAVLSEGDKIATITAMPSFITLKNGKKSYKVTLSVEKGNSNYFYDLPPILYDCTFDNATMRLLEELPKKPSLDDAWPRLRFKEGADLNRLCGMSVSELRSLFGVPTASISLNSSRFTGYCYDLFENVIWKRGKHLYAGGIRVWYDSTMTVVYVEEYQTATSSRKFKGTSAPLYLPYFPQAEPDPKLMTTTSFSTKGVHVQGHPDTEPVPNEARNLHVLDRIKYGVMYFCENTVGTTNPWAIVGILLGALLLFNLLVFLWTRFGPNYGSNNWVVLKSLLWTIPPTVVALVYVFRWPLLFAVLAALFLIPAGVSAYIYFMGVMDDIRCVNCHKWITPLKIDSKEGDFHPGSYQKTVREELISRTRSGNSDTRVYKAETLMEVSQDMTYTMKCPECGYIWEKKVRESRPSVSGPILRLIVTTTTERWDTITKTVTEARDSVTGTLLASETNYDTEHHSSTRTYMDKYYDVDRYQPYFNLYINGKKEAIKEYYDRFWDSFH